MVLQQLKRFGFKPSSVDMEVRALWPANCVCSLLSPFAALEQDYHDEGMESLADETFVVFLMATHGEGDPTDNAIGFYEYLKDKDREEDELKNVKFSCFGLGRPLASQTANATELTLRWRLQATGSTSTTTRWERYAAKHCRVSCPCVCVGNDCSEPRFVPAGVQ